MLLSSTKQFLFLCDKDIVGGSRDCDVPEGLKAILLVGKKCFAPVPMSRLLVFKGNDTEESREKRTL